MITIKKIDIDGIDDKRYNVSNLWPVDNYKEVLSYTETKNWINAFHKNIPQIKVTNIKWILEAAKIGTFTGQVSNMYKDEIEDFCKKYDNYNELMTNGVFIRTDHVSLKTGIHGIGPYFNIKQIIESICTCSSGHAAINKTDKELNIYLMPWLNLDTDKEFRIFVHNNKITGISIQKIYKQNKWLSSFTENDLKLLTIEIKNYFTNEFIEKWKKTQTSKYTKNFTMDLIITDLITEEKKYKFYFIEPNPFGPEYAAGSALFHWVDSKILYNEEDAIEFRYN